MNMLLARRLTGLNLAGVSVMATMNVLRMVTYGAKAMGEDRPKDFPAKFSDHELKQKLNPMEYHVTQEAGTERAFSGAYWNNKKDGTYDCIVCGHKLFDSSTKFDSGTGWPSFSDVVEKGNVKLIRDVSHGMARTEVVCSNCGAHLGHVFNDGPKPTGMRYCMNSASLKFKDRKGQGKQDL